MFNQKRKISKIQHTYKLQNMPYLNAETLLYRKFYNNVNNVKSDRNMSNWDRKMSNSFLFWNLPCTETADGWQADITTLDKGQQPLSTQGLL